MNLIKKTINGSIYNILIFLINLYQNVLSPITPARCRYYPTCSSYAKHALAWHGVWSGSWLLLKRLSRCQPWGGHGVDFVPLPLNRYHYEFVATTNDFENSLTTEQSTSNSLNINSSVYRDNSSYVAHLNHLIRH